MQTIKVLNSVAALGADAVASGGNLQVAGLTIPIRNIRPNSTIQAYVAETLQVTTVTPTSANSTVFSLTIVGQSTLDGRNKEWTVTVTSAVSASATTICTQLKAGFNAYTDIPVTFGGIATLVCTGVSGNAKFSIAAGVNSVGAYAFITTSPAAVIGYGAGTLIAASNLSSPDIITTNNYTTVTINYIDPIAVQTRNTVHDLYSSLILYVNEGDADYVTLTGTYGSLTQAIKGVAATWSAVSGNITFTITTGAITLGTGSFSTKGLTVGDVLMIGASAPAGVTAGVSVIQGISDNTANAAVGVGTNVAGIGAATGFQVTLRSAL